MAFEPPPTQAITASGCRPACSSICTRHSSPITDDEALKAFHELCRYEGIIPALESAHAVAQAMKMAPAMPKDAILLVNLSGRGDKDMHTVAERSRIHV